MTACGMHIKTIRVTSQIYWLPPSPLSQFVKNLVTPPLGCGVIYGRPLTILIALWMRDGYSFSRYIQNWDSDSFLCLSSKVASQHISSKLSFSQRLNYHVFASSTKGCSSKRLHFEDPRVQEIFQNMISYIYRILRESSSKQARNQFGTPGGAKSFVSGAQIFWTTSNSFKIYPTNFSRGDEKFSGRELRPLCGPWLRAWFETFLLQIFEDTPTSFRKNSRPAHVASIVINVARVASRQYHSHCFCWCCLYLSNANSQATPMRPLLASSSKFSHCAML